jgi:hypothetical protein
MLRYGLRSVFSPILCSALFLEGFAGFHVAVMASVYVFLKYAKLWELELGGKDDDDRKQCSRRLKILHIDPERNWGGGESQVLGLLSYLVERGHRNDLLTHPGGRLFQSKSTSWNG